MSSPHPLPRTIKNLENFKFSYFFRKCFFFLSDPDIHHRRKPWQKCTILSHLGSYTTPDRGLPQTDQTGFPAMGLYFMISSQLET